MFQLLIISLCFSLSFGYVLEPLTTFNGVLPKSYLVGKSSKVYVVSNNLPETIGNLVLSTKGQTVNGTYFSYTTQTGSLTPFIPSQDGDTLTVQQLGTKNLTGWLYITTETNFNVYPLDIDTPKIGFQPGSNIFFALESSDLINIPVAENLVVSDTVSLRGYVGVPEDNGKMFFDSEAIKGLTTYDQLQLTMPIFYFKSNGVDVKYDISYGSERLLSINFAGLLMTKNFPTYYNYRYSANVMSNPYSDDITFYMVCHFDNTQTYTVNVTLEYDDGSRPTVFLMNSTEDRVIQLISPLTEMKIGSNGPFALQFQFKNANPKPTTIQTTPTTTVATTTQSGRRIGLILGFLMILLMKLA
ncbi:hypothetical protein CAEBREN_10726 [Caenorhabditis brenneri]|uniref:CUB-like domain-containing protein n=1 Tax=Caenorhabditis brenneri TaxID=135651 RepID=G0MZV9_CAEBE|nr:hypothetical protein CAEBREN_10726 [Caenorhabditis brenneri]